MYRLLYKQSWINWHTEIPLNVLSIWPFSLIPNLRFVSISRKNEWTFRPNDRRKGVKIQVKHFNWVDSTVPSADIIGPKSSELEFIIPQRFISERLINIKRYQKENSIFSCKILPKLILPSRRKFQVNFFRLVLFRPSPLGGCAY